MPNYTSDELAAFLETVPYKALATEFARRNNALRRIRSGGRPKILKPCPNCGQLFGVRDLSKHKPQCQGKP